MQDNNNIGTLMLDILKENKTNKNIAVEIIIHAITAIECGEISINEEILMSLRRLKRKYICLYDEYTPSKKSVVLNLPNQKAVLKSLKLLTDNSDIKKADETLKAIEAIYELERKAFGLEKPKVSTTLKMAWISFTKHPLRKNQG